MWQRPGEAGRYRGAGWVVHYRRAGEGHGESTLALPRRVYRGDEGPAPSRVYPRRVRTVGPDVQHARIGRRRVDDAPVSRGQKGSFFSGRSWAGDALIVLA